MELNDDKEGYSYWTEIGTTADSNLHHIGYNGSTNELWLKTITPDGTEEFKVWRYSEVGAGADDPDWAFELSAEALQNPWVLDDPSVVSKEVFDAVETLRQSGVNVELLGGSVSGTEAGPQVWRTNHFELTVSGQQNAYEWDSDQKILIQRSNVEGMPLVVGPGLISGEQITGLDYKDSHSFLWNGETYRAVSYLKANTISILDEQGTVFKTLYDIGMPRDQGGPDAWAPQVVMNGNEATIYFNTFNTGKDIWVATFDMEKKSVTSNKPLVDESSSLATGTSLTGSTVTDTVAWPVCPPRAAS